MAVCAGCRSQRVAEAPPPPPPPCTRLIFGGDAMLSRYVGRVARQKRDPAWPFRRIAPLLASADIAFLNLETPFSNRGGFADEGMIFKAEPNMIEGLVMAGVDVVSTANNHARDCGSHGVRFTLDWLDLHEIAAAGTGRTKAEAYEGVVLERNGLRFGFLACTYDQSNGNHRDWDERVAMLDEAAMAEAVRGLRGRAEVVTVSMHAGEEYRPAPSAAQTRFARAMIEAGAALVVGHHPHVAQPVESYRGGLIFYSLGNLVFDQFHRTETQTGLLAEVSFRGASIERHRLHKVDLRDAVPKLAAAE